MFTILAGSQFRELLNDLLGFRDLVEFLKVYPSSGICVRSYLLCTVILVMLKNNKQLGPKR